MEVATMESTEIQVHDDIEALYQTKLEILRRTEIVKEANERLDSLYHHIGWYSPINVREQFDGYGVHWTTSTNVDRILWRRLAAQTKLSKFMLSNEWDKLQAQIEQGKAPEFTPDNARVWIETLKDLVYRSAKDLVTKVFEELTTRTYKTAASYRAPVKKRNNNGVDTRFILGSGDYSDIIGSYSTRYPTITDDLERVAYLLDGKVPPEKSLKETMREAKSLEGENAYMKIRVCANGNTHYVLGDGLRDKLNLIGASRANIGEYIKIKIVTK